MVRYGTTCLHVMILCDCRDGFSPQAQFFGKKPDDPLFRSIPVLREVNAEPVLETATGDVRKAGAEELWQAHSRS